MSTSGSDNCVLLAQLADRVRVPPAMLRSLEGSGVLRPRRSGRERWPMRT